MERRNTSKKQEPIITRKKTGPKSILQASLKLAFQFALLGATNQIIANNLGVDINTVNNWIRTNEDFRFALNEGRMPADAKVVNAAYKTAVGFHYQEDMVVTNPIKEYDDDGKLIRSYNKYETIPVTKYCPPSAWSAFKWLSLRRKDMGWAEITNINLQADININKTIDLSDMTNEELCMLEKIGMKTIQTKTAIKQLTENAGRS